MPSQNIFSFRAAQYDEQGFRNGPEGTEMFYCEFFFNTFQVIL